MACCSGVPSSDMSATVVETPQGKNTVGPGYAVNGSEEIKYSYSFIDNVFDANKDDLADMYKKWGRVLCVLDENVHELYGTGIVSCELQH